MAQDPGEWYEERRAEAERRALELAGARAVLAVLEEVARDRGGAAAVLEAAATVVRRLHRLHEQACDVGD